MTLSATEVAQRVVAAAQRGEELVSVLATEGPSVGARVIVGQGGTVEGTLGSPDRDAAAREIAHSVFATREPLRDNGLFAELHATAEQLFIFGAGHIAVPLADLAVKLGFQVIVLDDRTEFATDERFASSVRVRTIDLSDPLAGLTFGPLSYVVLVTRAHKHDFDLLRLLLERAEEVRYIGMIGSRRRVRAAFIALLEHGVSRAQLERVRAPIGLDIGAETPAEIAVSIAAELIAVRRGGSAVALTAEERVLERFF